MAVIAESIWLMIRGFLNLTVLSVSELRKWGKQVSLVVGEITLLYF